MAAAKTGFFVTFEGTEGAGKSTLLRALSSRLEQLGVPHTVTREPGGTSVSEKIRELILKEPMDPRTELFLYEAARAEHLARTVRPSLQMGHLVLCDRYTDSTLAYQGHARGLPWKDVKACNRQATGGLVPAMTVLLDIDPSEGLKRAKDPNRFEAEGVVFQEKVRKGFLKSRREDPRRWIVLPARGHTPEELAEKVLKEIARRWKKGPLRG